MNLTVPQTAPSVRYVQEGVSPEAEALRSQVDRYRSEVHSQTLDWRDSLQQIVVNVFNECQERGWDGYDAAPISQDARDGAWNLAALLPDGIQKPDIVPEADGRIALEWDRGTDMLLTLSVEGDHLVYAGILAGKRRSGEHRFSKECPHAIELVLSMHFAEARQDEG